MDLESLAKNNISKDDIPAPDVASVEIKGTVKRDLSPEVRRAEQQPLVREAQAQRDKILLSQSTLSKEDFYHYFSSSKTEVVIDAKQQNVGNCYLIAAIHAMSKSPHFELMCRTSMKILQNGNWEVSIPLMNKEGKKIIVTAEDIDPKGDGRNDRLLPVNAKPGIRVLEAAWIKYKFGDLDRAASFGGFGDEALSLFGGDSFNKKHFGGRAIDSEGRVESGPLALLSNKNMAELDYSLNNYDPHHEIVTVGSRHDMPEEYGVPGTNIILKSSHSYSVTNCDKEKQEITLADPHNTIVPITMSFEQFKQSFGDFESVEVDFKQLLANMKEV